MNARQTRATVEDVLTAWIRTRANVIMATQGKAVTSVSWTIICLIFELPDHI